MRFVFPALLAAIALHASAPAAPVPPKEIRKPLSLAAGKQIFVEAGTGDITVRPAGANGAELLARIEPDGDCPENKDRVARTDVLVDAIAEGLRVRTVQDKSGRDLGMLGAFIKTCDAPRANLTLALPPNTRIDLRAERSSVDVQDMTADLRIRVSRGRVTGKGLAGATNVDLRGGEVRLAFRSFEQPSRVQMMGGLLEVSLPKNARFDLSFEGHPQQFQTDFPAQARDVAHINGGGPRLDLSLMHGRCQVRATEPVRQPQRAAASKPASPPKPAKTKPH